MHVTFHIGLHCTDEDRALTCLLRNTRTLASEGCAISSPGRFRPALREAMLSLRGSPAPPEMQERLLNTVMGTDRPQNILFSSDSFLCVPQKAVGPKQLYPLAGERALWIRNLFPGASVTMCLALRNPATLIQALHARIGPPESLFDFTRGIDLEALDWHAVLARLAEALPDTRIVVWCHEDAPILWPEILALLAGRPNGTAHSLDGWDDYLAELLSASAIARMRTYLASNPPRDPAHGRRVIAAFLDRFANPDAVEQPADSLGWSPDEIAQITMRYEADIVRIGHMTGIELLQP